MTPRVLQPLQTDANRNAMRLEMARRIEDILQP